MNEVDGNQNGGGQLAIAYVRETAQSVTANYGKQADNSDTSEPGVVAYQCHGSNVGEMGTLKGGSNGVTSGVPFSAQSEGGVRRFTPLECERLQAFPDNYTNVKWNGRHATDTPRYHVLGNSMCVNVMRWIGKRIDKVEMILTEIGNRG